MNEVVITISIRLPEGVTPDVSYGTAAPPSPSVPATRPPAHGSSSPASGGWVCPEHGTSKVVPEGISKKTGKPYKAFTVCAEQGCDQKPPRGVGPSEPPPTSQGGAQFDDLPF